MENNKRNKHKHKEHRKTTQNDTQDKGAITNDNNNETTKHNEQ